MRTSKISGKEIHDANVSLEELYRVVTQFYALRESYGGFCELKISFSSTGKLYHLKFYTADYGWSHSSECVLSGFHSQINRLMQQTVEETNKRTLRNAYSDLCIKYERFGKDFKKLEESLQEMLKDRTLSADETDHWERKLEDLRNGII